MKTVDERIVQMSFDNKNFQKGIDETTKSLSDFDKSLSEAGKGASFTGLENIVGGVSEKFSALGTIAVGALLEIGRQAVQLGEQLIKSLTLDPVQQGFKEYELKISSVKTMLASGKTKEGLPVTLEMVNKQLDVLNEYADQTIYSFSDMTSNIGKFTNAGVDLEKSVQAIKGISNAAALSGSNSEQASRAMYNFAQALSAGHVQLIDWKSIELAGLATEEFRQHLIDAGLAAGTLTEVSDGLYQAVDATGEAVGVTFGKTENFRDSLKKQWLTTEVLTDTLSDYADETTVIGKKATEAATKIRTFSQLMDTTKEELGSGWAVSFEHIFGNFDEATELWTNLSNTIKKFVSESADARNKILGDWAVLGGRTAVIEGIKNIFEGLQSVIEPIKKAFENIFPPMTGQMLADISEKFRDLTENFKIGPEAAKVIQSAFEGLFGAIKFGWDIVKGVFHLLAEGISALAPLGDLLVGVVSKIQDFFGAFIKAAQDSQIISSVFNTVKDAIQGFVDKIKSLLGVSNDSKKISESVTGISEAFKSWPTSFPAFDSFTQKVKDTFGSIATFLKPAWDFIKQVFGEIRDSLAETWETKGFAGFIELLNMLLTSGLLVGLQKMTKSFSGIADSASGFISGISGIFDSLSSKIGGLDEKLSTKLLKIAIAIGILAAALVVMSGVDPGKLLAATGAMGALFAELAISFKAFEKIPSGNIKGMGTQLIELSIAIYILAKALSLLADIPIKNLAVATVAMGALLFELSMMAKTLQNVKDFKSAAVSLILLGVAINIMVKAVETLGDMNVKELIKGIGTIGVLMGTMTIFVKSLEKMDNGSKLMTIAIGVGFLAIALRVMAGAVEKLGSLDLKTLGKGLGAIAIILLEIVIFSKTINPAELMTAGAAMVIMGVALLAITGAIAILGNMDFAKMMQGLVGIGGALLIMGMAMQAMANPMVLAGAAAILIMSAALLLLGPAIAIIGSLPLATIGVALLALVGVFAILGVAALVLGPVVPIILALGASLALLGIGVLAAGAGLVMLAAGLAALAVGGAAGAAALVLIITELATAIPTVLAKVGEGIIALAVVIGEGAPKIAGAVISILSEIGKLLIEEIPKFINIVLTFMGELLKQLVEKVPEFTDAGMKIILGFLKGVSDNAEQVVAAFVELIINIINGLTAKIPDLLIALGKFIAALLKGLGDAIPEVVAGGFKMIIALINGLADAVRDNAQGIRNAMINLGGAMIDALMTFFGISGGSSDKTKSLGKDIIQGIIDGVGSMISGAVDAIVNVGQKIWDGVTGFFDSHSPSRLFMKLGGWLDEGLGIGITKNANIPVTATEDMGKETVSAMQDSMAKIGEALNSDIDMNPTITPVLDLSNVTSGANSINSMLSKNQSYSLAASATNQAGLITTPQNGGISQNSTRDTIINNNFKLENVTVRNDADIDMIAEKLFQKQQTAMRGKGMRVALST